jgi:hypothetical protein
MKTYEDEENVRTTNSHYDILWWAERWKVARKGRGASIVRGREVIKDPVRSRSPQLILCTTS